MRDQLPERVLPRPPLQHANHLRLEFMALRAACQEPCRYPGLGRAVPCMKAKAVPPDPTKTHRAKRHREDDAVPASGEALPSLPVTCKQAGWVSWSRLDGYATQHMSHLAKQPPSSDAQQMRRVLTRQAHHPIASLPIKVATSSYGLPQQAPGLNSHKP